MTCVFCTNTDIQERIVYEDDLVKVFPTNIPIVSGHLLVCPQRCVARMDELNPSEIAALHETLNKLRPMLTDLFAAEGFNFAWNEGSVADQSVPHVHIHMLSRKKGDAGITEYEPRKFLYRPGSREETPNAELYAVSQQIKGILLKKYN